MMILKHIAGLFPSDCKNKFIQFLVLITQKQSPYPFVIMNTERVGGEGKYW